MSHTIQLTTEQFEALQSGQPITIEPPKPAITKWEPIGGNYVVSFSNNLAKAGFSYKTSSEADNAAKAIRSYARQLAWLAENDDGWVADWSNNKSNKYYVYYNHASKTVLVSYDISAHTSGTIYMSQANATKLAQLMNDGIVEF